MTTIFTKEKHERMLETLVLDMLLDNQDKKQIRTFFEQRTEHYLNKYQQVQVGEYKGVFVKI